MNFFQHYTFKKLLLFKSILFGLALMTAGCSSGQKAIKVEIVKTKDVYQLLRDGEPYFIKGGGLSSGNIDSLSLHGGNSIRNWSTPDNQDATQKLLDRALINGVTVSLCLPLKPERWGFDYNDVAQVSEQFEKMKKDVLKYRNHPALLTWIIGNELNHSYTNPAVYNAVNDISKMIHELDPNHPTTTTIAGLYPAVLNEITSRATDLDFISLQLYGKLFGLPKFLEETGFDKPFMVTEWGAIGYWEMEQTSWQAPVEMTSTEKANNYLKGYQEVLLPLQKQMLGNYVFLWGQKQERTPTWFGLYTAEGQETESVDVMHYIWNGTWPTNRTPTLNNMLLDNKTSRQNVTLKSGVTYQASVDSTDSKGDSLTYRWEVKAESMASQEGGDFEKNISNIENLIENPTVRNIQIKAPQTSGAYRLFVYVYDNHNHAAHANIPFYVED